MLLSKRSMSIVGSCLSVALLVVSLTALVSGTTELGSLAGAVLDSDGAAIGQAHVVVRPDLTGRSSATEPVDQKVRSDVNGRFSLKLEPGFYDVCVMSDAFVPACQKVSVKGEETPELRFRLRVDQAVIDSVADTFPGFIRRRQN